MNDGVKMTYLGFLVKGHISLPLNDIKHKVKDNGDLTSEQAEEFRDLINKYKTKSIKQTILNKVKKMNETISIKL